MILSILGILCVAGGFAVKFFGKRLTSNKADLRYGIIKGIEKQASGYCLDVEYSKSWEDSPERIQIYTKRKPKKTEIILEEGFDGLSIYNGKRILLLTSLALWIIGAILCMLG